MGPCVRHGRRPESRSTQQDEGRAKTINHTLAIVLIQIFALLRPHLAPFSASHFRLNHQNPDAKASLCPNGLVSA